MKRSRSHPNSVGGCISNHSLFLSITLAIMFSACLYTDPTTGESYFLTESVLIESIERDETSEDLFYLRIAVGEQVSSMDLRKQIRQEAERIGNNYGFEGGWVLEYSDYAGWNMLLGVFYYDVELRFFTTVEEYERYHLLHEE